MRVSWDNPSGRPGHGAWRVEWTDGPTVATMRDHAEDLVRYCRPLTITMLRFSRFTTRQAWAAAMLTLAHRGHLPERPALALAAAEHALYGTDTADWDHLWTHAGQLVEQAGEDLYEVVALVHATVTKPRHETPPRPARRLPLLRGAAGHDPHRPARPILRPALCSRRVCVPGFGVGLRLGSGSAGGLSEGTCRVSFPVTR